MKCTITIALLLCCMKTFAQDSASSQSIQIPDKFASSVDKKIAGLDDQLSKQTNKYLNSLSKQEEKIFAQLSKLDTSSAGALLGNAKEKYTHLAQKLNDANGRVDKLLNGEFWYDCYSLSTVQTFFIEMPRKTKGKEISNSYAATLAAQSLDEAGRSLAIKYQVEGMTAAMFKRMPESQIEQALRKEWLFYLNINVGASSTVVNTGFAYGINGEIPIKPVVVNSKEMQIFNSLFNIGCY